MNSEPVIESLNRMYCAALPSVRNSPIQALPATLYGYVLKVSSPQQIRLCILTTLVFPLSMVPLELQRRMVNTAVDNQDLTLLLTLATVYLFVLLLHGGLKYARNVYLGRTAEGVIRILRKRILGLSSNDSSVEPGARVSMVSSETEPLGGFVAEAISHPLLNIGIVLTVGGYMLIVEPIVALVALAFFIPTVILAPFLQAAINRLSKHRTERLRGLGDNLVAGEHGSAESDEIIEDIYATRVRIFILKNFQKFFGNLMGHLGPLSVLTVGGWFVMQGDAEVGMIVAFISGLDRLTDPARQLLNFYRQLSQTRVQYHLVRDAAATLHSTDGAG